MTQVNDFQPIQILEVDISKPLPSIPAVNPDNRHKYHRAMGLIRIHTQPIGVVELNFGNAGLSPDECAQQIWDGLCQAITEHMQRDELAAITELSAAGLAYTDTPLCLREREAFLADAPFVSIVVATRDRPESLAVCLKALMNLDYPNYEIIIVDNAPATTTTADFIKRTYGNVAKVRYVHESRPGLSNARNRGLEAVKAEIVAFTDDDTVVDSYWLVELVKGFQITSKVGCVTGLILPAELETPTQLWSEQSSGFNKGFRRHIFDLEKNRPKTWLYPYSAGMFGVGASMAFTMSALRDIGGFDPALGVGTPAMGGEDLAAFFQIIQMGYAIVYEPTALLYHRHRREYEAYRRQVYSYGVGLTAYLTKCIFDHPRLLLDIGMKIPYGVAYILNPRSPKNAKKQLNYPRELNFLEWRGMLYGPLAYYKSRYRSKT